MAATLAPMNRAQSRQCVQRWRPHGGALLKKTRLGQPLVAHSTVYTRGGVGRKEGTVLFATPPHSSPAGKKVKMISQGRREESVTGEERGDIVGAQRNDFSHLCVMFLKSLNNK